MRNPHFLRAALICFLLVSILLALSIHSTSAQDTTLEDVIGSRTTGISFYYKGYLREVTHETVLDIINGWTLIEVDMSDWYGPSGAPVSGYPLRRICMSLPPECTNHIYFYANDTDDAQVFAFIWLGEWQSRQHPDYIYAMSREDMEVLTDPFDLVIVGG